MSQKYLQYLAIAQDAALVAGKILKKRSLILTQVNARGRRDIKLQADRTAEKIIISLLCKKNKFSVFSEEAGAIRGNDNQHIWIIDPLDGTVNYSHRLPICCVSIGLWCAGQPILGVIYDFNHDEMFTGLAGHGAWLNGTAIKVSGVIKKEQAILCTGFPVSTDFSQSTLLRFVKDIQLYKKVRLLGSAALSLAYVAAGRVDAYQENDIAIWDIAAGIAIVEAAQGCVRYAPSKIKNRFMVKAASSAMLQDGAKR